MSAPTKADQIANALLAEVVAGAHAVGSVLPRESAIAERFGVNRSVVREAVKKLEVHRLLRPVRRRGTVVLDPLASLSPQVLAAMLAPGGKRVDRAMLGELLEVRAMLDVEMNALAAQRRRAEDLRAMDACVRAMEAAMAQPRKYGEALNELALATARATRNRVFQMLVHWHRQIHQDLEDLFLLTRVPSAAHLEATRELVDAIRRRDADATRTLVLEFHRYAREVLLHALGPGERDRKP